MKMTILYFTRTGETKNIAIELGRTLETNAYELKDDKTWYGPGGFFKALWYGLIGKRTNITFNEKALEADRVLIMSPLWVNGPAPAVLTFLDKYPNQEVDFLLINQASGQKMATNRLKKKYQNIHNTYNITHSKHNEGSVVEAIKRSMT